MASAPLRSWMFAFGRRTVRGYCPQTLCRLEEVIPNQIISNRIMVDDHSEDDTIAIRKTHDWRVYTNPRRGVASGTYEALRHLSTKNFISSQMMTLAAKV